ncbi:hypothetical protein ACQPU1_06260 [Clostridium paraputrificum]|uniref:hypothetical protein n=1 Tax=Clostridium paraputrificum TaxID=29363 RepID=UPI003D34292A
MTSVDVDFIDLLDSKEHEKLSNAIKMNLGDTVTICDTDLEINEEQRVILYIVY